MTVRSPALVLHLFLLLVNSSPVLAAESDAFDPYAYVTNPRQLATARMLVEFFEAETRPPPFNLRTGKAFEQHKQLVRQKLLEAMGLDPLPQRVTLDLHVSGPLEHPWCIVRKVHYQIWPGIYSEALLYVPKDFSDKPRPAILSLTGHWTNTKANAEEQKRCLNFARLGYVVLATEHEHYENLALGISHQTHNVWSNTRALDVLESLPYVDKDRIGACGGSGGGLQTEMLLALDSRIKAATIVGMTCDCREFVFPHVASAVCVHFPGILRIANQPEISALGMPTPVLYITMDDFTKNFVRNSFPAIQQLYRSNGYPDHVDCRYWPTEHNYDRPKREATYNWMQKWLRNDPNPVAEPKTVAFPIPRLLGLSTGVPASSQDLEKLSKIRFSERKSDPPDILNQNDWVQYRNSQIESLRKLLGLDEALPLASSEVLLQEREDRSGVTIQSVSIPVEGTFRIPVTIVAPSGKKGLPPLVICSGDGRKALLKQSGPNSPLELARSGAIVVLPDLRFFGDVQLDNLIGVGPTSMIKFVPAYAQDEWLQNQDYSFHYHVTRAWERNAIMCNRPLVGMAVTDIRHIVDYLEGQPDVDFTRLRLVGLNSISDPSHSVPLAVLFAAVLDPRAKNIDTDLARSSYEARTLPAVPFILRHGDVPQWAGCLADRRLTLRNLPEQAGSRDWLEHVFTVMGHGDRLEILP